MRDHGEKEEARIVREGMKSLDMPSAKTALAALGKSAERKIVLAGIMRAKTSVNHESMVSAGRTDKDLAMKRDALTQILFPDKKSTR